MSYLVFHYFEDNGIMTLYGAIDTLSYANYREVNPASI